MKTYDSPTEFCAAVQEHAAAEGWSLTLETSAVRFRYVIRWAWKHGMSLPEREIFVPGRLEAETLACLYLVRLAHWGFRLGAESPMELEPVTGAPDTLAREGFFAGEERE